MTTLISSYLQRLEAAAADLPVERRDELVEEIRQHIDASTLGAGSDEAALRTLLDRLGTPEEIAAAAREDLPAGATALEQPALSEANPSPWGGSELAAVVLLGLGPFVLPLVGPLVGLVLALSSQRWTRRDKTVAVALSVAPAVLLVVLFAAVLLLRQGT